MSATAAAAAFYAHRLGWRVLPCEPGGKRPLLTDWPARATTDRDLIARWWGRSPNANVAVATGPGSGIFVLDVDGPEGERALVELERRHGPLPLCPLQWTGGGRGGWQAFFAWPEGRQISNSSGKLGAKLDTRGEGGYCLVPPSMTVEPYAWAPDRDPWTIPPEPAPGWLIDLLDPPEPPEPPSAVSAAAHRPQGVDAHALKAFETELKLTARAPEGERNAQLFGSAFSLLRLVDAGRLSLHGVVAGLTDAARAAGLTDREITSTLASAAKRRGLRL